MIYAFEGFIPVVHESSFVHPQAAVTGNEYRDLIASYIDLRIASLPTSFGERVVIRLLDKSCRLYSLEELGMEERTMRLFRNLVSAEHGLILVTGPTGSGKSTTLYAALKRLNAESTRYVLSARFT